MLSLRIKPKYKQIVDIPKEFEIYFWDCPTKKTYLEKFILRILEYGNFDEIRKVYNMYPKQTYDIASRYNHIKRGVKFWIKLWKEENL